jgi:hypothetical protein
MVVLHVSTTANVYDTVYLECKIQGTIITLIVEVLNTYSTTIAMYSNI